MGDFIFFFVLLLSVVGYESGKIVKRSSLVSRFTNNPFFLGHFSGDYGYEIHHPRVHFLTDSDFSHHHEEDQDEENDEEITNFTDTDNSDQENTVTEPSKTEIVEPVFNILPFYEKMHIFQREKPKELQKESNEETTLHLFKSLPHYRRTILFRETNPEITTTENDQVAVNYYFSSLPHYQTNQKFKEPTLFISKLENEENLFRNVPRIDVRSFQTPIPKRRKLVRVIKRKKIEDASEIPEIEFGRRIQPKITINSVADLPLENTLQAQTVFNSYGDLVLSQSS